MTLAASIRPLSRALEQIEVGRDPGDGDPTLCDELDKRCLKMSENVSILNDTSTCRQEISHAATVTYNRSHESGGQNPCHLAISAGGPRQTRQIRLLSTEITRSRAFLGCFQTDCHRARPVM
jgi:hypothetical protein